MTDFWNWLSVYLIGLRNFIQDWQTLLAGLLALTSAIWGVVTLQKQITLSEKHEHQRLMAKEKAARAVLPLTLSTIINYVEQSSNFLRPIYESRENGSIPEQARTNVNVPKVPESAIGSLQSMVEAAAPTNPNIADAIAKLIQQIQIQNSRMASIVSREDSRNPIHISIVLTINIESLIIKTAVIQVLAECLLEYARYEAETPSMPTWDNVSRALRLQNWLEHLHPDLYGTVTQRSARAAPITS